MLAFQVAEALRISLEENLELIEDSVRYLKQHVHEVVFDAEHFFDGYKARPDYALACLRAAADGRRGLITLCETNGGRLPTEVEHAVADVRRHDRAPDRHPHAQRRRAGGGQHAGRGARGRDHGARHDQRLRRALRQRQPDLDHPGAAA